MNSTRASTQSVFLVSASLLATLSCTSGGDGGSPATDGGSPLGSSNGAADAGFRDEPNPDPILCGGAYDSPCASEKVCQFDDGCGTVGHCILPRDSCDGMEREPVCGCDGTTYDNECEAHRAGVASQGPGACKESSTLVPCGPYLCNPGAFCLNKSETDDLWVEACLPLPTACHGVATCECLGEVKACWFGHRCSANESAVTAVCE